MTKRFVGVQDTTRRAVAAIVKANSNDPLTVSQIAKRLTSDTFRLMGKIELRQNVQNVVDRMVRHGQAEVVVGAKKTGRPVNTYRMVDKKDETTEATAEVATPVTVEAAVEKPAAKTVKKTTKKATTKTETVESVTTGDEVAVAEQA